MRGPLLTFSTKMLSTFSSSTFLYISKEDEDGEEEKQGKGEEGNNTFRNGRSPESARIQTAYLKNQFQELIAT